MCEGMTPRMKRIEFMMVSVSGPVRRRIASGGTRGGFVSGRYRFSLGLSGWGRRREGRREGMYKECL
jgi:hypothetical protein